MAVLKVHTKGKPLSDDVQLDVIARQTPGFSGADLANAVNEAAILAARRSKKKIGMSELQDAIERVAMGGPPMLCSQAAYVNSAAAAAR